MNTLEDRAYVTEALAALALCQTDADLVAYDDRYSNNERYIHLSEPLVREMEAAYDKRLWVIAGEEG